MKYLKGLILLVTCFGLLHCSTREQATVQAEEKPKNKKVDSFSTVTMLFAGDIMMHMPQINAANFSGEKYDFTSVFEKIKPVIEKADIAVGNLETTFGGVPYTGYPQFSAPDTLGWFLKQSGFDVIVTANNHSADRGAKGISGTINSLRKYEFKQTGTFLNRQERDSLYPLMIEKNGIKIALLNCTYGTNGLPVPEPQIVNDIDTAQFRKDIATAKTRGAEVVLMMFHWGIEYEREPNKEQKMLAKWCLQNGIDAVIGSHPHVLQPAVWENFVPHGDSVSKKGLVVYSLGNFISNQRDRYRNGAMVFQFTLKKNKFTNKITVENAGFYPTWVYIQPQPKTYYILPVSQFERDTNFVVPFDARKQMLQSLEDNRGLISKEKGITEFPVSKK